MTNKELAETFYKSFDTNQPDLLNDAISEDWKAVPAVPGAGAGREGQKGTVGYLHSVFQNFTYKVKEVIESADGKTVVTRAELGGTQVGEFLGVKPTDKAIIMETIEIHRVKDGKIYETHHIEDFMGAYQQLTR